MNTMNSREINPAGQYVVSYNNDDFYCNQYDLVNYVFTKIDNPNLGNKTLQSFCSNRDIGFYKNNNCKDIADAKSNDNINKQKCAVLNELCKNNENYDKLKEVQTTHYASNGRYNDMSVFYDTEMLKSVNLGIGMLGLSLIIHKLY
jgi:hypothetical protein